VLARAGLGRSLGVCIQRRGGSRSCALGGIPRSRLGMSCGHAAEQARRLELPALMRGRFREGSIRGIVRGVVNPKS